MQITTPDEVAKAMGIVADSGVVASAKLALDLSTPFMETLLETRLSSASTIDYFNYRGEVGTKAKKMLALRLTNRYIDKPIKIRYGEGPLSSANPGVELDPLTYSVHADHGVVYMSNPPVAGNLCYAVEYDSGYRDLDRNIPYYVVNLAISAAVFSINVHASTPAQRRQNNAMQQTNSLFSYLKSISAPYRRPRMSVEWPMVTEEA